MIRVVIADDEELLRESFKVLIEQDGDIEVAGCARDGREAFELCGRLQPDLVLMDMSMPGCDGVEGTKLIKASYGTKVLMLTVICDKDKVAAALDSGAEGYALKDIRTDELIQLIKSIVSGLRAMHTNVFDRMKHQLDSSVKNPPEPKEKRHAKDNLTDRERSVVRLIVEGKSNKEIASSLSLSEGRVRNIITNVLKKYKLADRTQLAIFAVKNDMV